MSPCWTVLTRVGGVLGRVAGVLSDKMGKAGKGKAAAGSGETWYQKKCRENPNFKVERAETARNARQAAAAADRAAAAPAAAAAAPAATAEAETATSPGFLERTMPRVFGRTAPAAAQQQPAPGGAPVSGGYTTAAALDGQRYPSGSSPSEVGYHAPEWAGLERAHQLLGVQLLEPGLLREEQLTRAAQRLARGEMPFNVGEWAASSAAFLVYGDFGPLETADGESLWGRRVIDDNFRFVGTNELAVVAGPTEMPALMRGATSLLQQTLPGAYGECADDATSHIDDETLNAEAHEALESAVQALGYYTCAVKEARKSLMPAEPLLQLVEKLERRRRASTSSRPRRSRRHARLRLRRARRLRRRLRQRRQHAPRARNQSNLGCECPSQNIEAGLGPHRLLLLSCTAATASRLATPPSSSSEVHGLQVPPHQEMRPSFFACLALELWQAVLALQALAEQGEQPALRLLVAQ